MKKFALLFAGFVGFTLNAAFAGEAPRGSVLELHSCEVYAGPCVVSSESPQEGRCMARAWDFTGGSFNGTDFSGLKIAVLQDSPDNLAETDSKSGDAVVYLPQNATQTQRDALLAWLKSSQADFHPAKLQTRVAPLQFTKSDQGYAFSAGNFLSVRTAPLDKCNMGNCGESLAYQPRAHTSLFTVALNNGSRVSEPLLKLRWEASGERNIFLGRFGQTIPANNLYVSLNELCGPSQSLF
ncbi:MAG TPA: DUF1326 domain-containing protein [Verrucomicrobiae bacterium]|jgi:hypothetical protein|nr:DUF1326 domain-containing protein [Verrucomicrobiae bacterium]